MWIEKWKCNGVLNDSWSRFIKPSNSTPVKMYGLVKTHKEGIIFIEYIRAWNSYHVETSLRISLCLLYGGFLYDINSCWGNSKQTIITSLFNLYRELIT